MENSLVIFNSSDGKLAIDVALEQETVWLSLRQIEQLFERDQSVISRHMKKIFTEELDEGSNIHFLHIANNSPAVSQTNKESNFSLKVAIKKLVPSLFGSLIGTGLALTVSKINLILTYIKSFK